MITPRQAVLIDTSTLMELTLHDPHAVPQFDRTHAAAVEAMVLFEQVYLDGRTVNAELPPFRWMDELDHGVVMVNNSFQEVQATYRRGMLLANQVARSPETASFLQMNRHASPFEEIRAPERYGPKNTILWGDVRGYVAHEMSTDVADFIDQLLSEMRIESPGGAIILARLCYYLALQERLVGQPHLVL
jgi:hypothetical protein